MIIYIYMYIDKYHPLYPHLAINSFHCGPAWNCWFPEAELQGDGLARQRGAIIDGLRTAVLERSVAGNMSCPYFVTTRLPSGNQAWRWNPPNSFRWFLVKLRLMVDFPFSRLITGGNYGLWEIRLYLVGLQANLKLGEGHPDNKTEDWQRGTKPEHIQTWCWWIDVILIAKTCVLSTKLGMVTL